MTPEKKPLRMFDPVADAARAGWYKNDLAHCVCCTEAEGLIVERIPRGDPVYYAGVAGLFYCTQHAPTDALGAPAHVEAT